MNYLLRLLGFGLFMGTIAYAGWWWTGLHTVAGAAHGWRAGLHDTLLFSAFALHHSLLARARARRWLERVVPADSVRSLYVWVASVLLLVVCMAWVPVGGTLYRATGASALALGGLQALGALLGLLTIRRINLRELGGLTAPAADDVLQATGPYRLVRHPLYLAVLLLLLGTPWMTGDRLLFASLCTVYIIIALPFEEAGLSAHFGARYAEYRQAVRWRLIPRVY